MAYCPKCNGPMASDATVCPNCGYDFPAEPLVNAKRIGIEYSAWADVALLVGAFVAALGCIAYAVAFVVLVARAEFIHGLIVAPVAFFLSLAMLVVFLRVRRM
jgi:hypothetical protein